MIQRDQKIMTSLQAILLYTYTYFLARSYVFLRRLQQLAHQPCHPISLLISCAFAEVNPGDFMEFDFSETHSRTLVIVMLLTEFTRRKKKERKKILSELFSNSFPSTGVQTT